MQILIVEDDVRLAQALAHILTENHYGVDVVHNGADGLAYAESGIYDVVILDVMLPKMDGFTVVAELRRKSVSTPVLLLTARDAVPDKITGLDSGADDYMTKPFSPAELLAHLRALNDVCITDHHRLLAGSTLAGQRPDGRWCERLKMLFCQCYAAAPSTYVIPTCDCYSALHGAPFFTPASAVSNYTATG